MVGLKLWFLHILWVVSNSITNFTFKNVEGDIVEHVFCRCYLLWPICSLFIKIMFPIIRLQRWQIIRHDDVRDKQQKMPHFCSLVNKLSKFSIRKIPPQKMFHIDLSTNEISVFSTHFVMFSRVIEWEVFFCFKHFFTFEYELSIFYFNQMKMFSKNWIPDQTKSFLSDDFWINLFFATRNQFLNLMT